MTAIEPYKATLDSPDLLNTAVNLAKRISDTEFVPKPMRGKPDQVMAALLVGRELGLGPMTALNHINIVDGKAAVDSALKQGKAESAGARFKVVEMTDERCTIHAWSAGDAGQPTVIVWSMKDAQRAGLTNKDNWKRYPRKMLFRRAMSEACDVVAGAAVLGLPPTIDEAADEIGYDQPVAATATATPKLARTVQRSPARSVQHTWAKPELPDFDADPPAQAQPTETHPPTPEVVDAEVIDHPGGSGEPAATPAQVKRAMAIMRGQGIDDDARHSLVAIVSNNRTEHVTELTRTEISQLFDQLEQNG